MRIGFVSTWGEVGAGYVTKNYVDLLKADNEIFIYPRGIRKSYEKDSAWDIEGIEKTPDLATTNIKWSHFDRWIKRNRLDTIFFNEQANILPVLKIKKVHPAIKIGTYVDYYTRDTVREFGWFDFIICNTRRHYSVFKGLHEQVYYVKWGVNVDTFTQHKIEKHDELTFFHSSGWSRRKGTELVIKTFVEKGFFTKSRLLIHTQAPFSLDFDHRQFNIEIINNTVPHPGLYHKGDVYLYPTTLEGLGLTMYEALVSGLPIVVPDNGPMNELVNETNGKLLPVSNYYSREDGYYWPLCECDENALADAMQYYISLKDEILNVRFKVREQAVRDFNWFDRQIEISRIFTESQASRPAEQAIDDEIRRIKGKYVKKMGKALLELTSSRALHALGKKRISGFDG